MKCVRFSCNLLKKYHSVEFKYRCINMSQKTLLSFFKPPKPSNGIASSEKDVKQPENSSSCVDSPEKVSGSKNNKKSRRLVESDDEESVEVNQKSSETATCSPVKSKPVLVDSKVLSASPNVNAPRMSSNVRPPFYPKKITAPRGKPGPRYLSYFAHLKTPATAAQNGDSEPSVKSEELSGESSAGDVKEADGMHTESEKGTGETSPLKESPKGDEDSQEQKESPAKSSKSASPKQGKGKNATENKDNEEDKVTEESKPTSASPKDGGSKSKKRKKSDEETSPKDDVGKKPRKTKKTVESGGKEESEKETKDVSTKNDAEAKSAASVEKSTKKGTQIHSFFTQGSSSKSSEVKVESSESKSHSSDVEMEEPEDEGSPAAKSKQKKEQNSNNSKRKSSPRQKQTQADDGKKAQGNLSKSSEVQVESKESKDHSSDVEMEESEDEVSPAAKNKQKKKQNSKRKSSPRQKKTQTDDEKKGKKDKAAKEKDESAACESPENLASDAEDADSHKTKSPKEGDSAKGKKRHTMRIIDSDEDEEEVDSSEQKTDDTKGSQESKDEASEELEDKKSPVNSFFAPRGKQDKSVKPNSTKQSKAASSSVKDPVYDPTKSRYHPIDDACWSKGEKVPYLALARTMEEIENVSGRLKMIEILANYFRSVIVLSPDDLLLSVYLCLNRIAPEYEGIEMGVGETLLMKAVAQATGRTLEKIKAEVAVKGDLGLVAESSRGNQRYMFAPPKLMVASVFSKFKEIALMSGNAAMAKKVDKIQALFVACRQCEARYIIRSLSGKLRIGLAEQSVLAALAQAAVLTPPNQTYPPEVLNSSSSLSSESFKKKLDAQALILKTTYCECPNYDKIVPVLLKEGIEELPNKCYLSAGIPLKPMLAHPTKGIDEVLKRFDGADFTCEFKYDGERAQIHVLDNREVKIYSRNQEDNTTKYPDIISRIPKALKPETKSCVLDTEAVAWDRDAKQILPFQQLSTRKRKDVVESDIKVQVCVVAFDLIFLNGKSLVKLPLKERRKLLRESFVEVENEFMFVHSTDGNTAEVMQEFLEESIKGNCEGLMVKSLEVDASYEIAKRSHNWLKLKKDYLEGVGDTLDLVVIGGYHGKGKRTGAYGGFLLACYDDENEEFQSICKIGTGFKEEELESHASFLKQHVIKEPKSYFRFDSNLTPDEWFEPVQVWEVKCADLSKSPVHKAAVGIVDPEKGISLRFPRFLRIRDDKKPEDATSSSQVARMYNSQEQIQNQKGKESKLDDEDFY